MPFINERINQNQAQLAEDQHKKAVKAAHTSRFLFEPDKVMAHLRAHIVGQEQVMDAMQDMLTVVKADFGSKDKPLAINMLLGSTGVGKTETVRLITEAIYGSSDKLCRIDMNTLAQSHYAAALTGAPPGYVGSKEGNTLFDEELIKGSFSKPGIVLFDEIEKASREVVQAIMNILDTGFLTLPTGNKRIDFRNSLIFMTSNIGAKQLATYRKQYQLGWRKFLGLEPKNADRIIDDALHGHFDPEFLNRIDRLLLFQDLEKDWYMEIFTIEINKLNARLQKKSLHLEVGDTVKEYLSRHYDKRFGARDLSRRLRTELEPALAEAMLSYPESRRLIAQVEQQRLIVIPS